MLFGPTNEEMITEIFRASVRSYKDLPLNLYHIQWKFRDEVRPRFGVMRSREFLMKDAYSFDLDEAGARHSYNKMFVAYLRTFARLGLKAIPMRADTGPDRRQSQPRIHHSGLDTGESEVFCHKDFSTWMFRLSTSISTTAPDAGRRRHWTSLYAATDEMHDAGAFDALPEDKKVSARGIEVGHIFYFGTKYSEPMRAVVNGPGRQGNAGADGLLRHRPVAPRRRADRGEPRRKRHRLAGGDRAVPRRPRQPQGRRRGHGRGLRATLQGLEAKGRRRALRRPRRAAGRQIRDHGSDRPALADHRRAEGPRRGQGRDEEPQAPASARCFRPDEAIARFA
jgi:hypothetical protein